MQGMENQHETLLKIAKYFVFSCTLALVCDIPDTYSQLYFLAKASLYGILFLTLLLPNRLSLAFLLILAVVGQDIVQTNSQRESGDLFLASVWQGSLGPLRPSWVFMLYCIALLTKNRSLLLEKSVSHVLLWFATIPLITAYFYGNFTTSDALTEIPTDMKAPLFLIVSILLFGSCIKSQPSAFVDFGLAFLGAVLARHAIDFAYATLGFGAQFGDVVRVSVDSTKGTVVFLLLFSLFLIMRTRYILWGNVLALASALLLVVYATRGLWVSAILGLILFALMMNAKKLLIALPVIGGIGYSGLLLLSMLFPDTIELASHRLDEHAIGHADNVFERYFPTRYAEILNATDATLSRKAILWGSGYGSYYTESAISFPNQIDSAFAEHSIVSGQYYTIHNFVFRTLFEYGVIGLLLLSGLWIVPGWRCYHAFQNPSTSLLGGISIAMVAFLPTSMFEMTWTGKGMIIGGFAITFLQYAYRCSHHSSHHAKSSAIPSRPRAFARKSLSKRRLIGGI